MLKIPNQNNAKIRLTDWMLWNCAEVVDLLVGGVEKVCSWGGLEMQDATPLHGDCFPDSISGIWNTKVLKVLKENLLHFTAANNNCLATSERDPLQEDASPLPGWWRLLTPCGTARVRKIPFFLPTDCAPAEIRKLEEPLGVLVFQKTHCMS